MALQLYKIGSVEVGSAGTSSIEFTSIPQGYTDLKVVFSMRNDYAGASAWWFGTLTFNGTSSTANWSRRALVGTGSGAGSENYTNSEGIFANANSTTANTFGNGEVYIPNYTSSNNKSISIDSVTENNATSALSIATALLWSNTAAITSLKLTASLNGATQTNWTQYSTATLYGIL
jgi:hypothetical protein